ncbi:MAG: hypothetical protein E6I43_03370 [Chloroflexi bacterium]|nr:MAG: hypothetical protein E6I43_03370 [Chloroflexota bacterium]
MGRGGRHAADPTARGLFGMTAVTFGFPAPGAFGPSHATIGTFDGVHRGHQALLKTLVAGARQAGAASVLITFEPHPRCVLDPDHCPPNLTTLDEKTWLLDQMGLDHVVVIPFTPQIPPSYAVSVRATASRSRSPPRCDAVENPSAARASAGWSCSARFGPPPNYSAAITSSAPSWSTAPSAGGSSAFPRRTCASPPTS